MSARSRPKRPAGKPAGRNAPRSGQAPGAVEVEVERMVHGGRAIARKPNGEIVLVAGALPGERVEARVLPRRGVWLGETLSVITPSPSRLPAPLHPGLDYGFIEYEAQLELKRQVVADSLARATGRALEEVFVPPVRPAPAQWGYRSVIQPAATKEGLGYRLPGSAEVRVLNEDAVASPSVNAAWRAAVSLRAHLARGARELVIRANDEGEALIAIVSIAPSRQLLPLAHALVGAGIAGVSSAPYDPRGRFRGGAERLAGRRTLLQRYLDLDLTVTATSFAQPNPAAAGELYRTLVDWAGEGEHAWELFAGGGAIAMHLAKGYGAVTAVELDRGAIARGEADADRLGLGNVTFVRADARSAPLPADAELLVVDPPRAGLAAELRAAIGESGVPRLIYVSCDVATWARDVADLEARGYALSRFEPFDFYPQTHHIEVLSELQRVT